ncbi:MAG: CvpA family protein [Anaerolineaceae bacterium]|jgi:hypothetical protein
MISLSVLFYILIFLFVMIGALRGWAKEVLVCFAGILALAIIEVVLPKIAPGLAPDKAFLVKVLILAGCAFIGYQTPALRRFMDTGRFERASFRDVIMGALLGAVNGYIFVGSTLYFLAAAAYPFSQVIPPDGATEAGSAAIRIVSTALPNYLHAPVIYYALILGSLIVIGVFI